MSDTEPHTTFYRLRSSFQAKRWASGSAVWLIFGGLFVVFFAGFFSGQTSFGFRDSGHYYFRLFAWTDEQFAQGHLPLWNPYDNTGVPHVADASTSVFYPGKVLFFFRGFSYPARYNAYLLLHLIWAAAGTGVFCRRIRIRGIGVGVAMLSFCFGGVVLTQTGNAVFLVSASWFPWAMTAIHLMRCRNASGYFAFAFVLSMMVLGGDPQMAYHCVMIAIPFVWRTLFRSADSLPGEEPAEHQDHLRPNITWLKRLCLNCKRIQISGLLSFGGALLLLVGMTAIQTLPTYFWSQQSTRASFQQPRSIYEIPRYVSSELKRDENPTSSNLAMGIVNGVGRDGLAGTHQKQAYDFSVPPWTIAETFWPNASGKMYPRSSRWMDRLPGADRVWNPSLYFGALPCLLALAGLSFRRRAGWRRGMSWLLVVSLVASLGWYGIGWLLREGTWLVSGSSPETVQVGSPVGGLYWAFVTFLPGYAQFRYPAKWLVIAAFAASILAAGSISHQRFERRFYRIGVGYLVVSVFVLAVALTCRGPILEWFRSFEPDPLYGPFQATKAHREIVLGVLQGLVVLGLGMVLLRVASRKSKWVGGIALLMVVAVDLGIANRWLIVQVPTTAWADSAAGKRLAKKHEKERPNVPPRFYRSNLSGWVPPSFRDESTDDRYAKIVEWDTDTLFPKHHLGSKVSLINSYGSITPLDWEALLVVARSSGPLRSDGVAELPPELLRRFGTDAVVLAEPIEAYTQRASISSETSWIGRLEETYPRAWLVRETEYIRPPKPFDELDALRAAAESLRDGDQWRDWSRVAVVEDRELLLKPTRASESEETPEPSATMVEYQSTRVKLQIKNVSQESFLVVNDYYNSGWRATLTNIESGKTKPISIHRVNRVMRGVSIPPGEWEVVMDYSPIEFRIGAVITFLTWIGTALAFAALTVMHRRRRMRAPLERGRL